MGSAKIIIKERDLSGYIPSFDGVYGAIVHPARKGRVMDPTLTTSESDFIAKRGLPDPRLGVFHYTAFSYFTKSNKLWSVRVTHRNAESKQDGTFVRDDSTLPSATRYKGEARFAGLLVRAITAPVDTINPNAVFSDESLVTKALPLGLVQDELDAYVFPDYIGNRSYASNPEPMVIKYQVNNGIQVVVSDSASFVEGDMISFKIPNVALDITSPVYYVDKIGTKSTDYEILALSDLVTIGKGETVVKATADGAGGYTYAQYYDAPTIVESVSGSDQIMISNIDFVQENDLIAFSSDISKVYTVLAKNVVPMVEEFIQVSAPVTVTPASSVYKVTHYEVEKRDAFLVVADSQGLWGDKTSIGIEKSKSFADAFAIVVYDNGVEVERWNDCTRYSKLDGYNHQMFIEDKINGNSEYIRVYNNEYLDETIVPLPTVKSYWRENAVDIFVNSNITINESVNLGDFYLAATSSLPIGTRIRIGSYTDEYKVLMIDQGQIVLDRPFVQLKSPVGSAIHVYDHTDMKPITALSSIMAGVTIGVPYNIGTKQGKILDAGANFSNGGDDGFAITVYDLMLGADLLANRESIPVTLIMDGGFAHPAYAQKLVQIAESRDDCFVYLSTDPMAEESADYLNKVIKYKNSLMINSSYASLFTGWVKVADPYNQKEVWVSPVGFAAASQSYTAGNFDMWYPAAGWTRGRLMALDVRRKYDEGQRDILVDNQINPIRYAEGSGLVIWGNETLWTLPSVLQSRHVRMLLIVIKKGLRSYLEGKHYDLNTERGRSMIEAAITAYMRDVIGSGVYGYTVAVNGYTTTTDIAQKRVKIFLGIQPTLEMKEFQVDLTLFSANQKIEIL